MLEGSYENLNQRVGSKNGKHRSLCAKKQGWLVLIKLVCSQGSDPDKYPAPGKHRVVTVGESHRYAVNIYIYFFGLLLL